MSVGLVLSIYIVSAAGNERKYGQPDLWYKKLLCTMGIKTQNNDIAKLPNVITKRNTKNTCDMENSTSFLSIFQFT